MARKAGNEEPKPESTEPIALKRLEERNELVPITADQVHERMQVAAGVIDDARILDREAADASALARTRKKAAEAKHEEADRIVLEARSGQMNQPYTVIVERHPTRATEMLVWRTPDGVPASDLLDSELPADDERIAAREAQGCVLVEQRAMLPEELEIAETEDHPRQNPPLPFPAKGRRVDDAVVAAEDADGPEPAAINDAPDGDTEAAGAAAQAGESAGTGPTDLSPQRKGNRLDTNALARVRIVVGRLGSDESVSMAELSERTGHHVDDLRPVVASLIEQDEVAKTGAGKGTRYRRKASPAGTAQ